MVRTFHVDMQTTATAIVKVEFSDDRLKEIAADLGVENPEDLTMDDLREFLEEAALGEAPDICASCSGWGHYDRLSMSLGEWEVPEDIEARPFYASKSVREVRPSLQQHWMI